MAASAVEEAPLEPPGPLAATHEKTKGPESAPELVVQPLGGIDVLDGEPAQVVLPDQLENCGVVPLHEYCEDCTPLATQALLNDVTEAMVWVVSGHVLGLRGGAGVCVCVCV